MLVDEALASEVRELIGLIQGLRADMIALEEMSAEELAELHPDFQTSGRNLLHYLILRQQDLRGLQHRLATLGLSSLGRCESHVLDSLDNLLRTLSALVGAPRPGSSNEGLDYAAGAALLARHTDALLDSAPRHRAVRIMVTMPSEAARDPSLIHELLARGMDCMRINCAHDGPEAWGQMLHHLDTARRSLGKSCLVEMDLGGPKLRTGPLAPGPAVVRVRPSRDSMGWVTHPARVWLTPIDDPQQPPVDGVTVLPVRGGFMEGLEVGHSIRLVDARGAKRRWRILLAREGGVLAEVNKTAYLTPGIRLDFDAASDADFELADLPRLERPLVLRTGDDLIVTRDFSPGTPVQLDEQGEVLVQARIGCSLPDVFDDVETGAAIMFDDGKIAGQVESIDSCEVRVRITRAHPDGSKLRADKGINLPGSELSLSALTEKDVRDLAFVVEHADIIGLSFVNSAEDVELLSNHVAALGDKRPSVVLKIETRCGFENLPSILLAAMKLPRCGVMIARGDLAVECGFVRLAEAQEEILWMCEAAHVPVIWATQVLETLTKEGMPSRAEITDAAMGDRAECVMLNKGPHILTAVGVLDDILQRMQAHQAKKQSMLRELKVAHRLGRTPAR
jgi:pyruvate kinase